MTKDHALGIGGTGECLVFPPPLARIGLYTVCKYVLIFVDPR